jgi:hypothetical protein
MGSSTILDIIGSSVVFVTLLLVTLQLNDANTENMQIYQGDLVVQENLVEVTSLLEYDFRKIGYCYNPKNFPDPTKSILLADSNRIKFVTDLTTKTYPYGDGIMDTIYYYLGPTSELTSTPNPNDRYLYRVVNSQTPQGANLGVTTFSLKYYDALDSLMPFPITNPGGIKTMQITVVVQDLAATSLPPFIGSFEQQYSSAYWRQIRLVSRNLGDR